MDCVKIDHYSDILCIWAYVGHARTQELQTTFADKLDWSWHYLPVFGDFQDKMKTQWQNRGGAPAYAAHVNEVVEQFDHVNLHSACWTRVQPASSAPAHLWLAAAKLAEQQGEIPTKSEENLAWALRQAFFEDAVDVAQQTELACVCNSIQLPPEVLQRFINDGSAFAALCNDMLKARDLNIRISPTYAFNNDRQLLTGNVGYRIIEANVKELLEKPQTQHSWC